MLKVIFSKKVKYQHPRLNAFIKRNKLILLNDVTVNVLIEREFNGEKVDGAPAARFMNQFIETVKSGNFIRE